MALISGGESTDRSLQQSLPRGLHPPAMAVELNPMAQEAEEDRQVITGGDPVFNKDKHGFSNPSEEVYQWAFWISRQDLHNAIDRKVQKVLQAPSPSAYQAKQ